MKLTKKEIDKIIRRHQHWLNKDCKGWSDMRADLSNADLNDLDLSGVNLAQANLTDANLRRANLTNANLAKADLSNADLFMTDLFGANLAWARLSWADLTNANLTGADLHKARLEHANLTEADLHKANLTMTDLEYADIYTASFDPKEEFRKGIVLKKAIEGYKNTYEGVVITAEIPAGAVVFSINGKKCRTSTATITDMAGQKLLHSQYDHKFTYRLGKKIMIPNFDTRYNVECSTGFHFFRTKEEAWDY